MANTYSHQTLVDDLKVVLEQAEDLLGTTAGVSNHKLESARRKLSNSVDGLRDKCGRLQRSTVDIARASGEYVKEHPYETAGASLALLALTAGVLWIWRWR